MVLNYIFVGCLCLLGDRGVLLTKLAGTGITKSSWKCRPQNSRFFLSKSVKKSVKRGVRVLRVRSALASHSLVPDLLFDCSRVLQLAKIPTVLQSIGNGHRATYQAEHSRLSSRRSPSNLMGSWLPGVLSRHGEVIAGVPQGGVVSQLRMSTILRTASPGNTCIHLQVR